MRSRAHSVVIALVAALVAPPSAAAPASVIAYAIRTVERHDPACRLSRTHPFSCGYVRFEYPVIERAPTRAAAATINQAVRDHLLASWGEPKFASLEEEADTLMQVYRDERRDDPSYAFWLDDTVAVLYQSAAIVAIKFDMSAMAGGAHPNRTVVFANFNATTGKKVTLDDVLVARYRARLTRIAANEFRAQHDVKPGMTLHDAGYVFFKNDTFALTDNFWFGPRGVAFFYNNYEIAPYAMGPSELFLSYRGIGDLIRPDGLLRSMR